MTDLQQAAERLRRIHQGEDAEAVYGRDINLNDFADPYVCDLRGALGEWLAEHDPTPIDEAWLRSVGLCEREGDPWDGVLVLDSGDDLSLQWEDGCVWLFLYADCRECCHVKTRGAFRRLASVLGLSLTEKETSDG